MNLKLIQRFVCAANLQKNQRCEDFEVRFCCPVILTNNCPDVSLDENDYKQNLENLTIDDIRKLNIQKRTLD